MDEWQLSPTPLTPDIVTGPSPATPPLPPPILPCHHHPPTCPPDTTQNLPTLSTQMLPVFITEFSNHDSQSHPTYPPFQPTKKVLEYHQTFAK